ncbi:MAG: hypothetical protein KGS72_26100 [Cyanobacteria bacterium REEB67]|nr:hypothetical protein [Cyanobacteria bacterium REEB67]
MTFTKSITTLAALLCLSNSTISASAQQNYQQMEKLLDQVEQISPPSTTVPQRGSVRFQSAPINSQTAPAPANFGGGADASVLSGQQGNGIQTTRQSQTQSPASTLRKVWQMFNGNGPKQQAQPASGTTPKPFNVLKIMFGDDNDGDLSGNASRAQTQAEIAHDAYLNSCYGDRDSRCQAADEAYYAAEEARHEADNAEDNLKPGRPGDRSYAETARDAADQAEADAEAARYNADSE